MSKKKGSYISGIRRFVRDTVNKVDEHTSMLDEVIDAHKKHDKSAKVLSSRLDAEMERAIRADFLLNDRIDVLERRLKELCGD